MNRVLDIAVRHILVRIHREGPNRSVRRSTTPEQYHRQMLITFQEDAPRIINLFGAGDPSCNVAAGLSTLLAEIFESLPLEASSRPNSQGDNGR